ncbi:hypothetical protein [Lysobacter sp. F6437]|uniref:hypothetical protein n=1 Tax=Lysobacter sp. F6437 TaxID=3459296 RepID=UPI00403E0958
MRPVLDSTLILPVPPAQWSPPITAVTVDGIHLDPKRELHITLIGGELLRELRATFGDSRTRAVITAGCDEHDWHFNRTGHCLLLRKPIAGQGFAHSIIERVELPAMAPFHQRLGCLLGRELPVPAAHVTLYVAGRPRGIGVASDAALRALQLRPVAAAELSG